MHGRRMCIKKGRSRRAPFLFERFGLVAY
jgi:hypothetical protein